jgi:hypothetical protein
MDGMDGADFTARASGGNNPEVHFVNFEIFRGCFPSILSSMPKAKALWKSVLICGAFCRPCFRGEAKTRQKVEG